MYDKHLTYVTSNGDVRTQRGGVLRQQTQHERAASRAAEYDDEYDDDEYEWEPGLLSRLWHYLFH